MTNANFISRWGPRSSRPRDNVLNLRAAVFPAVSCAAAEVAPAVASSGCCGTVNHGATVNTPARWTLAIKAVLKCQRKILCKAEIFPYDRQRAKQTDCQF